MSEDHDPTPHRVVSHLGELLEDRGLTLVQLAALTGVTVANLSVLKNGRARAIRFSTLSAICQALDCRPGDLLDIETQAQVTSGEVVGGADAVRSLRADVRHPPVERRAAAVPAAVNPN